jgi:hypothetical protein
LEVKSLPLAFGQYGSVGIQKLQSLDSIKSRGCQGRNLDTLAENSQPILSHLQSLTVQNGIDYHSLKNCSIVRRDVCEDR